MMEVRRQATDRVYLKRVVATSMVMHKASVAKVLPAGVACARSTLRMGDWGHAVVNCATCNSVGKTTGVEVKGDKAEVMCVDGERIHIGC